MNDQADESALRIPVNSPRSDPGYLASWLYGEAPAQWGRFVRGRVVELVLDATPRSPERVAELVRLVTAAGATSVSVVAE